MQQSEDIEISIVSEELDNILSMFCIKHKMPPLAVSAITLARLIHLNNSVNTKEDFGKLLLSVGNSILNGELEKPGKLH